jgi:hypothetical protein
MRWVTLVVVLTIILSGCTSAVQPDPAHLVSVSNNDDNQHTVSLTVTGGNNTVFTESRTLPSGETHGFTTITESGTHRIEATTENRTTSTTVDLPIDGRPNSTTAISITENGSFSITTVGQDYGS